MSAWRRKAVEQFPELRRYLTHHSPAMRLNIYDLAYELQQLVQNEPTASNPELMRRIFDYAEWAAHQPAPDTCNAIGVGFYEHVFDRREEWERAIPHLSPFAIRNHWMLWKARPTLVDLGELERVLSRHGKMPSDV